MPEVLSSLLSTVKPRPQLAKREVEAASRFVLDEAKFLAVTYEEAPRYPPFQDGERMAAATARPQNPVP